MTDETADLIAFVRAAGGQVTNRMVLRLCDAFEAGLGVGGAATSSHAAAIRETLQAAARLDDGPNIGAALSALDALAAAAAREQALRPVIPSLISYALAGPSNEANVAARNNAVDAALAALAVGGEQPQQESASAGDAPS